MAGAPKAYLIALNRTRGETLASRVVLADDYDSRSKGLLGRTSMDADEGMWIVPCPMIHTFFMKFPIDVVFLSKKGKVVKVIEDLKPWRLSPWVFSAHSVLELAGGALKGRAAVGEELEIA